MNYMDGKYRCQYSSSHRNDLFNNKNPVNPSNDQSKTISYSYLPAKASVIPALPKKTLPSSSATPQERQSCNCSVQTTKINTGTEQKTQYLEKMLRMQSWIRSLGKPNGNENIEQRTECSDMLVHITQQQKSSVDSTTFDRIRFADQQIPATATNITQYNNLSQNSFHLISNVNNDVDEISIIEDTLFNNQVQSDNKPQATDGQSTLITDADPSRWSGFLIDDCDEVAFSPISPAPCPTSTVSPPPTSSVGEIIQQNQEDLNKQRAMLVYEFNTPDAEKRQQKKRQKRLNKNLQNKKKPKPAKLPRINSKVVSITKEKNHHELPSDWIIEYDAPETDQISQSIKEISTARTVDGKAAKITEVLEKMKEHEAELKKLRQHALSLLNEEPKSNSTDTNKQNSSNDQEQLLHFLSESITSGCWLCSGKKYTEVATQCNN